MRDESDQPAWLRRRILLTPIGARVSRLVDRARARGPSTWLHFTGGDRAIRRNVAEDRFEAGRPGDLDKVDLRRSTEPEMQLQRVLRKSSLGRDHGIEDAG
jgi:hypothetical protein